MFCKHHQTSFEYAPQQRNYEQARERGIKDIGQIRHLNDVQTT